MRFFRQEYWNGLPFPSPGDLPDPGTKLMSPVSPASQAILYPLKQIFHHISKWLPHYFPREGFLDNQMYCLTLAPSLFILPSHTFFIAFISFWCYIICLHVFLFLPFQIEYKHHKWRALSVMVITVSSQIKPAYCKHDMFNKYLLNA